MIEMHRLVLEGERCTTHTFTACRGFAFELTVVLDVRMIGFVAVDVGKQYADAKPGVSVNLLFLESHLALHTWPEHEFVVMEISSCKEFDKDEIAEHFKRFFEPARLRASVPKMVKI